MEFYQQHEPKTANRRSFNAFIRKLGLNQNSTLPWRRYKELILGDEEIKRIFAKRQALEAAMRGAWMMPTALIPNPASVNGLGPSLGTHTISSINGDAAALAAGTAVQIVTPFNTVSGTVPIPFNVKKVATTATFLNLGVVAGPFPAQVAASSVTYPVGAEMEVVVLGHAQGLFDANNTTAGHLGINSSATAGQQTDSATATLGKTQGVILNTVTLASAGLVDEFVRVM